MKTLTLPLALCLLATAADAAPARRAPDLTTLLAGRTAGKPVQCLPILRDVNTMQVGEGTIIYSRTGNARDRTIYRNDPPGGCAGAGRGNALVARRPAARACRGDIIQVRDLLTGVDRGSCALGDFVPYTKAR